VAEDVSGGFSYTVEGFTRLPLVSEICASTASAEPQSAEQEQAEKRAVDHALRDYNDAFGRGDLSAIGQHCNVPFVRISSQGARCCLRCPKLRPFTGASCETSESAATRIAYGRSCM
jgi:hypothetical protein